MIVSTKGRYALRVMIDLAEHQAERYVPLKEVAERQEISEKYLENILKVLVQNGFLEGLRGMGGGYLLTRTPAQWKTQWDYLKTLMKALQATDPDGNGNPDTLAQTIKFSYKFVFENITVSNIASAIRLLNYMRKAKQGFDLYVSEDGVNFQTITVDGFGDPYNHGLRVFATTDQGLCLGTANPFYGTQVWIKRKDS